MCVCVCVCVCVCAVIVVVVLLCLVFSSSFFSPPPPPPLITINTTDCNRIANISTFDCGKIYKKKVYLCYEQIANLPTPFLSGLCAELDTIHNVQTLFSSVPHPASRLRFSLQSLPNCSHILSGSQPSYDRNVGYIQTGTRERGRGGASR